MLGLGFTEIGMIAALVILLFGSSKLPQFGKGLGEAISGFRSALKGQEHIKDVIDKTEQK